MDFFRHIIVIEKPLPTIAGVRKCVTDVELTPPTDTDEAPEWKWNEKPLYGFMRESET